MIQTTTRDPRVLIAIPVYNEARYARKVLARVLEHTSNLLVVDDGSTDETPSILRDFPVTVIRHDNNQGYGRAMRDAFGYALAQNFDWVITMDCDEQHEPDAIPWFVDALSETDADVVSGSRYLAPDDAVDRPPADRRAINGTITEELNERLNYNLTDAFCGFKAYRVAPLSQLELDEDGYAFPMQFWVQARAAKLKVAEIPVRLIYNDPSRTFGGPLNDADTRLEHYRCVLHNELAKCVERLPSPAVEGLAPCEG